MKPFELPSESEFPSLLQQNRLVLVDFYADWCEPCGFLAEVLDRLSVLTGDSLAIIKVDIEQHQTLRHQFRILSVPVLVLFSKGEVVWRMNGFKMEEELLEIVQQFSRETE